MSIEFAFEFLTFFKWISTISVSQLVGPAFQYSCDRRLHSTWLKSSRTFRREESIMKWSTLCNWWIRFFRSIVSTSVTTAAATTVMLNRKEIIIELLSPKCYFHLRTSKWRFGPRAKAFEMMAMKLDKAQRCGSFFRVLDSFRKETLHRIQRIFFGIRKIKTGLTSG